MSGTVAPRNEESPVIRMSGIRKSFNGVEVLHGVDLDLRAGEVHALLGGNGAGKSTLMKILLGVHQPDVGTIERAGRELTFGSPRDATDAGIAMVFQELSLAPSLTISENIYLGREPLRRGIIDTARMDRDAATLLDSVGVSLDPRTRVAELSVGHRQLTEIAKALSLDANVLVLDEPTASLPKHEVELLFDLIGRLRDRGLSLVYISHRMAEIDRIADTMTVLRDGDVVLHDDVAAVPHEDVIGAIVGRRIHAGLRKGQAPAGHDDPPVLSVDGLLIEPKLTDVSFEVHRGEVVGLAGLIGTGRTEIAECLFGIRQPTAGHMRVGDKPYAPRHPRDAVDAGVMLLPESRQAQGLVMDHPVRDNVLLPALDWVTPRLFVDDQQGRAVGERILDRLQLTVGAWRRPVRELSGGNQQKVALAKWLVLREAGHHLDVLVLDEPTSGVDIGTKTEIMQLVLELAATGVGVVVISSELEELLAVSDRVLVLRDRRLAADLPAGDLAGEEALQMAIQGVSDQLDRPSDLPGRANP